MDDIDIAKDAVELLRSGKDAYIPVRNVSNKTVIYDYLIKHAPKHSTHIVTLTVKRTGEQLDAIAIILKEEV